jgi:hypothetical protein
MEAIIYGASLTAVDMLVGNTIKSYASTYPEFANSLVGAAEAALIALAVQMIPLTFEPGWVSGSPVWMQALLVGGLHQVLHMLKGTLPMDGLLLGTFATGTIASLAAPYVLAQL